MNLRTTARNLKSKSRRMSNELAKKCIEPAQVYLNSGTDDVGVYIPNPKVVHPHSFAIAVKNASTVTHASWT